MLITCPNCDTSFTLPDELFVPGRKARCSQCRTVFTLPESTAPVGAAPDAAAAPATPSPQPSPGTQTQPLAAKTEKPKRSRKLLIIMVVAIAISLAGIGFGSYMIYSIFFGAPPPDTGTTNATMPDSTANMQQEATALEQARLAALEERVKLITLEDIRQYVVQNEKLGNIVVIQGLAVNGFSTPKELIAVEVKLYDQANNVLASKTQVAGAKLDFFQLQILSEAEITDVLNNKVNILTNNTNVVHGGKVPFVVFFAKVPETFYEFEVRPISASDPEKN